MNRKQLARLGIPAGLPLKTAIRLVAQARQSGMHKRRIRREIEALVEDPSTYPAGGHFAELAGMLDTNATNDNGLPAGAGPAPWQRWGSDLQPGAIQQMKQACSLPVAVQGALMPDAHHGYGLPIGGVLATDNAVIPYAVGMDIACRMQLTVLDLPPETTTTRVEELSHALEKETSFGCNAGFRRRRTHPVLEDDWNASRFLARLKDRAWAQLGSSGSGNHFAEFGVLTLEQPDLELEAGDYLALLSHSGSRNAGLQVAQRFSKLARDLHPELPGHLAHLAWLNLDSAEGQEYWQAMELMGRYAEANHELIHRHLLKRLRAKSLAEIKNHHNFAWKETHGGREVIVHRKGATPAHRDRLGIIPGSMATPGYVVRGRGNPDSLDSAAHGAGRRMSRAAAKQSFIWSQVKQMLAERGVTLLSAGIDESPDAYKDIGEVMAAQSDLVDIVARFQPRIVKMAP